MAEWTVELDGRETVLFVCPRCGEAGHCPEHESTVHDGKLTMRRPLACGCGGHYFLTDGVLKGGLAVDTPKISDFPDELERLAEWRRRRVEEERRAAVATKGGLGATNRVSLSAREN